MESVVQPHSLRYGCAWSFADVQPCLFDVLDVVWGPVVDQSVESSDVVDDDLIPWVSELFVVLVIDDVCQPTLMESKVCG